jgi:hypothetical protein
VRRRPIEGPSDGEALGESTPPFLKRARALISTARRQLARLEAEEEARLAAGPTPIHFRTRRGGQNMAFLEGKMTDMEVRLNEVGQEMRRMAIANCGWPHICLEAA